MTTEPYVTPKVRAEAQRRGVNLSTVTPTGMGGRIRLQDVQAAAGRPGTPVRAEAPARRAPVSVASHFGAPGQEVTLDVYGPNPLVDEARQLNLIGTGPAPTLFADGELPPFTASGVDPRELRKVPWYVRHAVAAAPSASTVLKAIEHFAHDPEDWAGEYRHNGAQDYVSRVREWFRPDPAALTRIYDTSITVPLSGRGDGGYRRTSRA